MLSAVALLLQGDSESIILQRLLSSFRNLTITKEINVADTLPPAAIIPQRSQRSCSTNLETFKLESQVGAPGYLNKEVEA